MIMNKKSYFFLVMAALFTGSAVTSCTDDDDNGSRMPLSSKLTTSERLWETSQLKNGMLVERKVPP